MHGKFNQSIIFLSLFLFLFLSLLLSCTPPEYYDLDRVCEPESLQMGDEDQVVTCECYLEGVVGRADGVNVCKDDGMDWVCKEDVNVGDARECLPPDGDVEEEEVEETEDDRVPPVPVDGDLEDEEGELPEEEIVHLAWVELFEEESYGGRTVKVDLSEGCNFIGQVDFSAEADGDAERGESLPASWVRSLKLHLPGGQSARLSNGGCTDDRSFACCLGTVLELPSTICQKLEQAECDGYWDASFCGLDAITIFSDACIVTEPDGDVPEDGDLETR